MSTGAVAVSTGQGRPPGSRGPSALRGRFGREALGVAVLAVLALVCAGLIVAVVLKTQADAQNAAREAAAYTPPPLTEAPTATGPAVAVIGDESVNGAASGVTAAQRWPALLSEALDSDVVPQALPGAGYATDGEEGGAFTSGIEQVPADATAVVFVGGAADAEVSALALARAATETFAAAAERAPDARIVVVGPLYRPRGVSAASFTELRNVLRGAAAIAEVRFVDPVDADWVGSGARADGLSEGDSRTVSARIRTLLESADD